MFRIRSNATLIRSSLIGLMLTSCGSALGNNAISDITWTFGPDMPALRKGGAMGVVNGTIVYASGGESGTVYQTNTTFGYVPGAAAWTLLPPMPAERAYLDGITVNDQLFAVDGRIDGYAGTTMKTIFRLRYQNGNFVWDNFDGRLTARTRAHFTVGKIGTKIYSVGGGRFTNNVPAEDWDRQLKDADVFDAGNSAVASTQLPDLPGIERFHPATVGVAGKLYVFGGTNIGAPGVGYDSDRLSDAYVYDPATNAWSGLPNLPFGYAGGSAEVYKDRFIILTGGVSEVTPNDSWPQPDPGFYNNMVIVYDTRYQTYDVLPSLLPEATGDIRTVIIGDKLYAAGGETKGPLFNSKRLRIGQLVFGPGEWDADSNEAWGGSLSWSTSTPNGVGSFANFLEKITSPRTVTLDTPVTVGYMTLSNANAYTITGSSTLTLQVASSDGFISLSSGNHSILAPMRMVSPTKILGPGALTAGNITNNALLTIQTTVTAGAINGTGRTFIAANRTLTAAGVVQNQVDVFGTLTISQGRSTSKTSMVGTLSIGATSRLDLGDNDLIVNYTGATPFNTIKSQIITGYANGSWNGVGINSSAAAVAGTGQRALGYAEASTLGMGSFSGQTLDGTAVIVRYTAPGDANLDGVVNSIDFTRFVTGYGSASSIWINGDFDYNGKVNSVDFNLLAGNFGTTVSSTTLGSVVPEPAISAVVLLGVGTLARRRTR
jgi:hypothetical protein